MSNNNNFRGDLATILNLQDIELEFLNNDNSSDGRNNGSRGSEHIEIDDDNDFRINSFPRTDTNNTIIDLDKEASKIKTPPKRPYPESDDETITCTICTEEWTSSGTHQVSSLPCGHLYGKSCIQRWYKTRTEREVRSNLAPCPFCNYMFKIKEIRPLYTRNIKALDISEKEEYIKAAKDALKEKDEMKKELEKAVYARSLIQSELNRTRAQLEAASNELLNYQTHQEYGRAQPILEESPVYSPYDFVIPISLKEQFTTPFFRYKCKVDISPDSNIARVMNICYSKELVIIGRKFTATSFGITFFNIGEINTQFSFQTHSGQLRDIKVLESDNLTQALSVGMDNKMILSDLNTQTIQAIFPLPGPGWSCCHNTKIPNHIFAGTTGSRILEFDSNSILANQPLRTISCPGVTAYSPIHSLYFVGELDVLIGANIDGVYLWALDGSSITSCKAILKETPSVSACYSLTYDPKTKIILASFRQPQTKTTLHIVGKIIFSNPTEERPSNFLNDIRFQKIFAVPYHSQEISMPKTHIFFTPDPYLCARDDAQKEILVWKIPDLQSLDCNIEQIDLDSTPIRFKLKSGEFNDIPSALDFKFIEPKSANLKPCLLALTANSLLVFEYIHPKVTPTHKSEVTEIALFNDTLGNIDRY